MTDRILGESMSETLGYLLGWLIESAEFLIRLALLLAAAALAGWAAGLVTRLVVRKLDGWAERVGIEGALHRCGVRRPLSHVIGHVVFLMVGLMVARLAAEAVGLPALAAGLGSALGFAPRVLVAGAILLGGVAVAGHIRRLATQAARDVGIEYASTLGTLASGAIVFGVALVAVSQLQITTDAVWLLLGWILAGLSLALGLSFGLGARDSARDILAGLYARRIFRIGQRVEIAQHRGVLISITPTNALIEEEDAIVSIPNSRLLREAVRRSK